MEYQQYNQTEYQQTAGEGKTKRPGAAVAALVLGILGILTSCAFGVGAVFGIIAIILAIVAGKKQKEKDGVRTTGLVLGIVGTGISLLGLLTVSFMERKSVIVQTARRRRTMVPTREAFLEAALRMETAW